MTLHAARGGERGRLLGPHPFGDVHLQVLQGRLHLQERVVHQEVELALAQEDLASHVVAWLAERAVHGLREPAAVQVVLDVAVGGVLVDADQSLSASSGRASEIASTVPAVLRPSPRAVETRQGRPDTSMLSTRPVVGQWKASSSPPKSTAMVNWLLRRTMTPSRSGSANSNAGSASNPLT